MYLIFPAIYKGMYDKSYGSVFAVVSFATAVVIPAIISTYSPDIYKNIEIALTRVPLFILGTGMGRSIKENKHMPYVAIGMLIAAGTGCRYYAVAADIKGYAARYASGLLGIALILIFTYSIHFLRKRALLRRVLRFFGRYSLEFYLLHVAMWGMFAQAGIPMHRSSRYMTMVVITIILAPLLSAVTGRIGDIKAVR